MDINRANSEFPLFPQKCPQFPKLKMTSSLDVYVSSICSSATKREDIKRRISSCCQENATVVVFSVDRRTVYWIVSSLFHDTSSIRYGRVRGKFIISNATVCCTESCFFRVKMQLFVRILSLFGRKNATTTYSNPALTKFSKMNDAARCLKP